MDKYHYFLEGIHYSNLEKIKKYINKDNINKPILHKNNYLEYPLYSALNTDDVEIIRYFLELGADPNKIYIDDEFNTLQYIIAESKENWKNMPKENPDMRIVKLLIEYGVNINTINKKGLTPLDYSIGWGLENQAEKYLRSLGAKTSKELEDEKK